MSENVELVRRVARTWVEQGPEAVGEYFHEDFSMTQLAEHPESGTFVGPDAAYGSVQQWMETFEDFEWELGELVDLGAHVVVEVHERARVRGSSVPVRHSYGVLVGVRDGKLVSARWFPDVAAAVAAAGAPQTGAE